MNHQPVTTATLAAHLGVQKNAWYRATRQAEVGVTARQAYEQAPSVWAYAARCAAQGAKR
jgi:hypothetical protein